jgi:hypothetical protein
MNNPGPGPVIAWTGVKVVKETLAPKPGANPTAPLAVAGGLGGAIYVQWQEATSSTIALFSASGAQQAVPNSYVVSGGHTGRTLAVPTCVNGQNQNQDCALLALDTSGAPLHVYDCLGTQIDFSSDTFLGAIVVAAGGSSAVLASRHAPANAASSPSLAMTPIHATTPCAYLDDEGSLYPGDPNQRLADGYGKGRLIQLAGVPSGFTVTAAARQGASGTVVGGANGATGPAWVVSVDSSLALVHQGSVAVGGNISTVLASLTTDAAGNVYACGTSRSHVFPSPVINPKPIAVSTTGWVAQGTPDLASWATLTLPLAVDGCALTTSGALAVSGTYSGTYKGQTSQGTDAFLALVTPGMGGAAPALAKFARYGSTQNETVVSAPFAGFGSVYLAGVTQGDWGAAVGVGQNKVFVARFDPTTLALH